MACYSVRFTFLFCAIFLCRKTFVENESYEFDLSVLCWFSAGRIESIWLCIVESNTKFYVNPLKNVYIFVCLYTVCLTTSSVFEILYSEI